MNEIFLSKSTIVSTISIMISTHHFVTSEDRSMQSDRIEALSINAYTKRTMKKESLTLTPQTLVSFFERSNDSTTTNDENSCARVNHVSADIFIQRGDRTVGWNETKEEAQAELHNATRETQEWKKPLVVGKWPWARYRSVFGHDGFIVEIYTLYTPLRIVISKVERISRGVLIYIYISIVRFDNGRVFPEKNWRIVFWIGLWKDASNWKGLESRMRERS